MKYVAKGKSFNNEPVFVLVTDLSAFINAPPHHLIFGEDEQGATQLRKDEVTWESIEEHVGPFFMFNR